MFVNSKHERLTLRKVKLIYIIRTFVIIYGHQYGGLRRKPYIGAHSARETPVPMPNTAVKPRSGYNTWFLSLGK